MGKYIPVLSRKPVESYERSKEGYTRKEKRAKKGFQRGNNFGRPQKSLRETGSVKKVALKCSGKITWSMNMKLGGVYIYGPTRYSMRKAVEDLTTARNASSRERAVQIITKLKADNVGNRATNASFVKKKSRKLVLSIKKKLFAVFGSANAPSDQVVLGDANVEVADDSLKVPLVSEDEVDESQKENSTKAGTAMRKLTRVVRAVKAKAELVKLGVGSVRSMEEHLGSKCESTELDSIAILSALGFSRQDIESAILQLGTDDVAELESELVTELETVVVADVDGVVVTDVVPELEAVLVAELVWLVVSVLDWLVVAELD